jgi:hypothetical protein
MSIPVPPFAPSPGQAIQWCTPTAVVTGPRNDGDPNGSATATLSSAVLTLTNSHPLGNWMWAATWTDFTDPNLPAGATINGIYPVLIGYGNNDSGAAGAVAGSDTMSIYDVEPDGLSLAVPDGGGIFSGQYSSAGTGDGLGTSSSDVTGCHFGARVFSTAFEGGVHNNFYITYIGLAVYFTPAPIVYGAKPVVAVSIGNTRFLN